MTLGGACPFTIDRPVMTQRWARLTFLHWRVDADLIQRTLPDGLTVETSDGSAWVGLIPFVMDVGTPRGHQLPWVSHFCETNVRTYVRDRSGNAGIWFYSLDAARLGAVLVARTTYRLPYFWSQMRVSNVGGLLTYDCRRRWPGTTGPKSRVRLRIGDAIPPDAVTDHEHFLTARWRLFSTFGAKLIAGRACHPPWGLHRATPIDVDDQLVAAAGFRVSGEPLVHYSPGVDVTIGRPESVSG